jgi:hypothetical protein
MSDHVSALLKVLRGGLRLVPSGWVAHHDAMRWLHPQASRMTTSDASNDKLHMAILEHLKTLAAHEHEGDANLEAAIQKLRCGKGR